MSDGRTGAHNYPANMLSSLQVETIITHLLKWFNCRTIIICCVWGDSCIADSCIIFALYSFNHDLFHVYAFGKKLKGSVEEVSWSLYVCTIAMLNGVPISREVAVPFHYNVRQHNTVLLPVLLYAYQHFQWCDIS